MSTSIYGAVEIRKFDSGFDDWFAIIDVGIALGGDYDLFACLFGVRNLANFRPLFPARGAPPDCSREVFAQYREADYYNNLTWCTYQELLDIDRDELSDAPDSRIVTSMDTPDGPVTLKRPPATPEEWSRRTSLSRGDALQNPEFQQLMELMAVLAKSYGTAGVRMVVWFD
jgi:hypothetical protein